MPAPLQPTLPATSPSAASESRQAPLVAGLLLVLAAVLSYANSLGGPFVYDDKPSILYNASIRSLTDVNALLHPPGAGATVSGRPVLNVSFAVNYAISGTSVRGFHVGNIAIHALAALTFFGLLRRTLQFPAFSEGIRRYATITAAIIAALWAVHPLQTESVTYLVQRAEALMSLFYLATLYFAARSFESPRPLRWQLAAWVCCALGMASKENMVSAPLVVLLFDRAFVAGTLADAWRKRRGFHLALASTWILLVALVLSTGGNRNGSAGFDVGMGFFRYLLTQVPALARYGALTVWPHPLVFDYGAFYVDDLSFIAGRLILVTAFLAFSTYAVFRLPKIGFACVAALAVLAPTSLVPGTTQMIVEHRMYLPLAAILALLAPLAVLRTRNLLFVAGLSLVLAFGILTSTRNRAYRSDITLWADTVAKAPNNAVAHASLGAALSDAGRKAEAMVENCAALSLNPNHVPSLANYGLGLTEVGKAAEALPFVQRAVELDPKKAEARLNLGITLDVLNRPADAMPQYAEAVRLNPLLAAAHNDYGDSLSRVGRQDEAITHLKRAIELEPTYMEAYINLAGAYVRTGNLELAQETFERGQMIHGPAGSAHLSWANFLLRQGHPEEALRMYAKSIELDPNAPEARYSYGTALAARERYADAMREFEAAIRIRPDYAEAHNNLANALLSMGRLDEAIVQYRESLRLRPADAATHNNLGLALARSGRLREAEPEFAEAVRIAPDFTEAVKNLSRARAQLFAP